MDFHSYMEIAKFFADRHDKRRQYEWKISISFWALIIFAILKKEALNLTLEWWHGVGIILVYSFFWIRGLHVANENDKKLSEYGWKKAIEIDEKFPDKIGINDCKSWFGFLCKWAMQFHIIVTTLFVFLFFMVDC